MSNTMQHLTTKYTLIWAISYFVIYIFFIFSLALLHFWASTIMYNSTIMHWAKINEYWLWKCSHPPQGIVGNFVLSRKPVDCLSLFLIKWCTHARTHCTSMFVNQHSLWMYILPIINCKFIVRWHDDWYGFKKNLPYLTPPHLSLCIYLLRHSKSIWISLYCNDYFWCDFQCNICFFLFLIHKCARMMTEYIFLDEPCLQYIKSSEIALRHTGWFSKPITLCRLPTPPTQGTLKNHLAHPPLKRLKKVRCSIKAARLQSHFTQAKQSGVSETWIVYWSLNGHRPRWVGPFNTLTINQRLHLLQTAVP